MLRVRVIPCLLLRGGGLYKTTRFSKPVYIGDPINAVRIFNEKEVDELIFLDIGATSEGREPNFPLLRDIASECFMPMAYGGGIRDTDQVRRILSTGFEKVVINTAAQEHPALIEEVAKLTGSQSVVVSVDVKKDIFGRYTMMTCGGRKKSLIDPVAFVVEAEQRGAGEIMVNSIDRDGTMSGYDLAIIKRIAESVSVPVVACGGAGRVVDFVAAIKDAGATAVAAGAMFVFHGPHRAVLINMPERKVLEAALGDAVGSWGARGNE